MIRTKLIYLFIFLVQSQVVISKEMKPDSFLKLSNSSSVTWPLTLNIKSEFLPSFSSFSLSGEENNHKFTAWISHKTPEVLANLTSVERVWKENQENAKKGGEISSKDSGCKEISKFIFRCVRDAELKPGEFVTDSLYWNGKKDLVFVRVNSLENAKYPKDILKLFKVKFGDKK
jgi:hypothetical protein